MIFTSRQFIPLVIRDSVAIAVIAYHHNPWFRRTTFAVIVCQFIETVAVNHEIHLPRGIDDRMVETEYDISAKTSKRDHDIIGAGDGFLHLFQYVGIVLTGFILRHDIYELPRSRIVFIYFGYVRAVINLFVKHSHPELEMIRGFLIHNIEDKVICSLLLSQEYVVALCRQHFTRCQRPPVRSPRQRRSQGEFLHPVYVVTVIDSQVEHRSVIRTRREHSQRAQWQQFYDVWLLHLSIYYVRFSTSI